MFQCMVLLLWRLILWILTMPGINWATSRILKILCQEWIFLGAKWEKIMKIGLQDQLEFSLNNQYLIKGMIKRSQKKRINQTQILK